MSTPKDDGRLGPFPFSSSFQFREDEKSTLEAFFENVYFDAPIAGEAFAASERIRFRAAAVAEEPAPEAESSAKAPAVEASGEGSVERPHVILLRGADGIGKTRVFRHLREKAHARSVPVYEIHNYDVEGIPLKPFLHTIRQIVRDLDSPDRSGAGSHLLERYRYALEILLPEAFGAGVRRRRVAHRLRERLESDKLRIFDGITQLLLEVSARQPLLILVHDLHWGDRATVELIRYIGRNLDLRNRALVSPSGGLPPGSLGGPEIEDFTEDWRGLAAAPSLGDPGGLLSRTWVAPVHEGDESAGEAASGGDPSAPGVSRRGHPSRLMLLANYRAFGDPAHYIQQSIDNLGEEPYAFHGELRPLSRREASRFLEKTVESVRVAGNELEVTEDAIDAVHELSEGFPSFQQELFRGVFVEEARESRWTGETLRSWVRAGQDEGSAEESGLRRLAILRRRLAHASDVERRVLEVLALARRPVSPEGVAKVLRRQAVPSDGASSEAAGGEAEAIGCFSADDGGAEALAVLRRLEERGLIERAEAVESGSTPARDGAVSRSEEPTLERYHYRLWDYVFVVEAAVDPEIRKRIHQRIGDLFRGLVTADEPDGSVPPASADAVYEVYYHLSRGLEPVSAVEFGLQAAERFERSFAFEKAISLYRELAALLADESLVERRVTVLGHLVRVAISIKDHEEAAAVLKRIQQETTAAVSDSTKFEHVLLEAEVARADGEPARALKIIGKASRLVPDENSLEGAWLNIVQTQLRLDRQDWKRAINLGLKGVTIAQKIDCARELGTFYQLMARAFYKKGDYTHAVDNYQRGLEVAEKLEDRSLMIDILDEIGRVYLERGNYFRAARYLYKSLEERRRRQDVVGLSRSYDQLGLVYRRDGDYHKCIDNLNRSLALKERIGDYEALNPTLGTLGDLYFRLGDYGLALEYFRREVENCRKLREQRLDETGYLVDSFCRQGTLSLEIGDLKRAESLSKQVSILASEFKLKSHEADGLLLEGNLKALGRDWTPAEKSLRQAADLHAKLGHRIRETCALLDLAEVKFQRELYDEALKLVQKAQITAEDVKALDLRVRALTIKANIHRFLKGGNAERVQEHLGKALELGQNLNDVRVLFNLFYSAAKVYHANKEYGESSGYYGKAEAILKRIGDRLPEDLRGRYFEDPRRKVFAEDLDRFRKEAQGRLVAAQDARERSFASVDLRERPVSAENYKALLERVLRVHKALSQLHFAEIVLAEGCELCAGERALVLRVQQRQYQTLAVHGFGKEGEEHPDLPVAVQIAEDAIRRGKVISQAGGEEDAARRKEPLRALRDRAVLVVPLMTEDRVFGALYLDKPIALGRFTSRDQSLLEVFGRHAGVAFQNRQQLDVAVREPTTGFFTPSYFNERLREEYRLFNLHGKSFSLAGFYLPVLEDSVGEATGGLGEKLAAELAAAAPGAAVCWGNPILYILYRDVEPAIAEESTAKVLERLEAILGESVPHQTLVVDRRYQQGSDMYFEIRRALLPEECDHRTLTELRHLLASDITLKEAKRILEKHIIESTLRKTGGNITHAARELGLHRPQLSNYLKKYGLKREIYERDLDDERIRPLEN